MNSYKTLCAHCVFRKNDSKGIQNGCDLGRIEKFITRNEAKREKDYYTIDRFCNTCRSEGNKDTILKEVEVTCSFIVDGTKEYWNILKSILKQETKPRRVFVVFRDIFDKNKYNEYQELFNNSDIQLIFKKYFEEKTFPRMVDDVVLKCETQFYTPINSPVNNNLLKNVNKIINEDLVKLNAIVNKDYYGSVISCLLHKILGGNRDYLITEKIDEFLKEKPKLERDTIVKQ